MSIRFRLSLIYTGVLVVVFFCFGLVVYSRSKASLLNDVDRNLAEVALNVTDQTKAYVQQDETVLFFTGDELDVFQNAATFMIATDNNGQIVAMSNNLSQNWEAFDDLLDPTGLGGENRYSTVSHSGQTLRVLSAPLTIQDNGRDRLIGHLQVARVMNNYQATLSNLRWTLLLAGWAAVSLSLFLEDLLSHNSLKPLYDITRLASHITRADDLSRRLPETRRKDEIGHLTTVLNDTLERLENIFRAQQRLLADVSHELRTPLTTIRGNVDLMRRIGIADPESLDAILEETERMTRLVNDLLLLARAEVGSLPLQRQPVALDMIVGEVYQQVYRLQHPVELVIEDLDQAEVMGDPDRLKQLILNLVNNAIKYTRVDGRVNLRLARLNGQVRLSVQDSGCGIPAEDLPHIFERFYRVDKARARPNGGSGLGLAIAKWITEAHDGEIQVQSVLGEGTTFIVLLPALENEVPATLPAHTDEPAQRSGTLRILRTGR